MKNTSYRLAAGGLLAALATTVSAAPGGIAITEWMYNPAGSVGEFVELTNFGPSAINMAGWSFDDNSRAAGSESLAAFGVLKPGQSVVFTEASEASFRSAWNLPASVLVIGGIANNLGRSDEINIYNGSTLVDRLTFNDQGSGSVKGPRTQGVSGVPVSLSAIGANNASQWVLSAVGNADGAYASVGGDISSPGHSVFAPAVPEPESWALMVAGLGVLGWLKRRRLVG